MCCTCFIAARRVRERYVLHSVCGFSWLLPCSACMNALLPAAVSRAASSVFMLIAQWSLILDDPSCRLVLPSLTLGWGMIGVELIGAIISGSLECRCIGVECVAAIVSRGLGGGNGMGRTSTTRLTPTAAAPLMATTSTTT